MALNLLQICIIHGGDYIEIKVVIPRFPYPKITALSQVLRGEDMFGE